MEFIHSTVTWLIQHIRQRHFALDTRERAKREDGVKMTTTRSEGKTKNVGKFNLMMVNIIKNATMES